MIKLNTHRLFPTRKSSKSKYPSISEACRTLQESGTKTNYFEPITELPHRNLNFIQKAVRFVKSFINANRRDWK